MDKSWKVIVAFIGVFIAGAVFGGFFALGFGARSSDASATPTALATPPSLEQPVASDTPKAPEAQKTPEAQKSPKSPQGKSGPGGPSRPPLLQIPLAWQEPQLMRRYADRLDLTSEQKEKINPLIQRAADDYRRLQQNALRETRILIQRLNEDIRSQLTPTQIGELDKMEQRMREIMEKNEQRQRELQKAEQQKQRDRKNQGSKPSGEKRSKPASDTSSKPSPSAPAPTSSETSAPAEVTPVK